MTKQSLRGTDLEYGLSIEIERVRDEQALVDELLQLDDKDILELGCGRAEKTRTIAEGGRNRRVLALEVDEVQHEHNRRIEDLPNVRFALGGAERIPAADRSFDVVFLFKSLHHVPVESMDDALADIARVLRPGGYAYVSEPLFRGEFNDLLRIFHDESRVRREAFAAIARAVGSGNLALVSQSFFLSPLPFASFAEFEESIIGVTHSELVLTEEAHARVRAGFARLEGDHGVHFLQPIRVDLLQRPLRATPTRDSSRTP